MICKKCDSPKTVVLRQKDFYCDECFMISTNHKFRACLGKNKILAPNEKVLICLSGGVSSSVLLDLIQYGISLENTKKLRIVPFFIHIFDVESKTATDFILEQCKKYNFNVYMVHLSDYLNTSCQLPEQNCIPEVNCDVANQFHSMQNSMPPTARNDLLLTIKRTLFIKYAKLLQCNIVFTAETSNTLAIKLLCNLAVGRGSQVQNDIGFSDTRDEKVRIIRPMRDISKEELDYYIKIKQLYPICNSSINNTNSLQSVIASFVFDLQENFQSTISTVCKTADKIGVCADRTLGKCLICESNFNDVNFKLSALEATSISRTVSFANISSNHNTDLSNIFKNDSHTAVFPLVHKYLCYGCSRIHSEMKRSTLPPHLQIL
ncbi:unnamed protein product [Arctia plantaginis]|uniref:Cytoplasmic tRNA 2-thiolation protein 2 n=1 Tax=Arctia plantaginis TaxID=874455 RepID=A0A8S1A7Y3_ARCPL|nr:unnamed protein product [Arctia plantaginis]CAB3240603.1 unnamed protein product [Arctia plantaginis]